jgi:hypothetical protein
VSGARSVPSPKRPEKDAVKRTGARSSIARMTEPSAGFVSDAYRWSAIRM